MKRLNLGIGFSLSLLLLFNAGCASSGSTSQQYQSVESEIYSSYWTLEDFLRRASGVQLNGTDDDIQILIRGYKSVSSPLSQPLFIVDGQKAGRNYVRVSSMFSRGEIRSVEVLTPGAASIYGMEGNFGVIVINSKYADNKNS